jgi:protein-tyrosine phosphatase
VPHERGRAIIRPAVIDLHCHPLPAIDDGPPTMADAVALARVARDEGIETLVATPHVTTGLPENDGPRIAAAVAQVAEALAGEGIAVELVPGAEVTAGRALELGDAELRALRLGSGPWLLLECPLSPVGARQFPAAARAVAERGFRIVLAHPERSPAFLGKPRGALAPLVEDGMVAQVTAGALVGRFGRRVRDAALELLRAGLVHNVASDAHDAVGRSPSIAAELEAVGYADWIPWLAQEVPRAILAGAELPAPPPQPSAPPTGWRRLLGGRRGG